MAATTWRWRSKVQSRWRNWTLYAQLVNGSTFFIFLWRRNQGTSKTLGKMFFSTRKGSSYSDKAGKELIYTFLTLVHSALGCHPDFKNYKNRKKLLKNKRDVKIVIRKKSGSPKCVWRYPLSNIELRVWWTCTVTFRQSSRIALPLWLPMINPDGHFGHPQDLH